MAAKHRAIFLDRDGVIIENRAEYIRRSEEVIAIPQALQALARIRSSPYKTIIVTNQSAVGRGIISLEEAWEINRHVVKQVLQAGGRIDAVYMCPHVPEDACPCRKPQPGLIHQAAQELSIDLVSSIIIGDALTDLLAGQAAGVGRKALVCTGRGEDQAALPLPAGLDSFRRFDNLSTALEELVPWEEAADLYFSDRVRE